MKIWPQQCKPLNGISVKTGANPYRTPDPIRPTKLGLLLWRAVILRYPMHFVLYVAGVSCPGVPSHCWCRPAQTAALPAASRSTALESRRRVLRSFREDAERQRQTSECWWSLDNYYCDHDHLDRSASCSRHSESTFTVDSLRRGWLSTVYRSLDTLPLLRGLSRLRCTNQVIHT